MKIEFPIEEIIGAFFLWSGAVIAVMMWINAEFRKTRHTINSAMMHRFQIVDDRLTAIEKHIAKKDGVIL